ncbi:Mitochondrial substrate carrier family protein N (Solute carrier family 25 member 3 homolog) [Durusdinium trenchii]|uniref:Mitochondrial substrate carrier family protein N (Solute carrier family 25 member 3 homolog) n=1 Tax=Durusdinium trenchii TaxID=1381693 RepID=A0ABP0L611_9DINO
MSEIFNSDPFVPPALAAPATRTRSAPSHRPVWEQNERRGSLPWLKGCGYALPLCVTWAEVEFFDALTASAHVARRTGARSVLRAASRREVAAALVAAAELPSAASAENQTLGLSWLPIDEEPQTEEIFERFESDKQWSVDFIVYLARILLNYDQGSAAWWHREVVPTVDATLPARAASAVEQQRWQQQRAAKLRDVFADYAASVEIGLRRYQEEGRRKSGLLKKLVDRYGETQEGRRQLALAFTLLEDPPTRSENDQPLELLSSLLSSLQLDNRLQAVFSPALSDYLAMDPTRLLPNTQFPVWNGGLQRWVIPGFQKAQPYKSAFDEMDQGAAVSVFGVRGAEVVTKERQLNPQDYALFVTWPWCLALSGAFGCSLTHSLVIPLDVVKTRLQTSPGRFKNANLLSGMQEIYQEEGLGGLLAGWEPTILGYLWYGITVYPGYEFFKRLFLSLFPQEELRVLLVLLSGAVATVFACFGVCPAEACRIRMVADPELNSLGLLKVIQVISEQDGPGVFYDGLSTLLVRQVLFGMMKFLVFDYFADFVFDLQPVLAEKVETQLLVSLLSGAVAGIASSIVSQPADTILTRMNQSEGRAFFFDTGREIWAERGLGGFFAGLGSRSVWAACIISGQFFLYDLCKSFLGVKDLRMFLNVQV